MSLSMFRRRARVSLLLLLFTGLVNRPVHSAENLIGNGGFETGLVSPWGTGQYSQGRTVWWNNHNCRSRAEIDETTAIEGLVSLHIVNLSPRAPQVYGTTAQQIPIESKRPYRITVWVQGLNLASEGAVTLVVDDAWEVRPISLPGGTYAWTKLSAIFSLPADHANIRILSEDAGEAWIDDINVTPLDSVLY